MKIQKNKLKKLLVNLPLIVFTSSILSLSLTSCNYEHKIPFSQYANIKYVINQTRGWYQTKFDQFGNKSTDEFPPQWDFRQTWAHRNCGNKTFTWTKENVDNSQNGYLKINYKEDTPWTDPNDPSFTTDNFSGSISTEKQFEQAFGYWEVDAKFLNKHYGWAAFWLQCASQGQIGNGGKDGSEIDIFESFNWNDFQNEVRLNTMADGYGDHYKEFGTSGYYVDKDGVPINTYNDFHKFGFLWTPYQYYMFIDRNLIFSTTAPIANHAHPTNDNSMGICQVPCYAILSGHMGPSVLPGDNKAPNGLPFDTYTGEGEFLIKNFACYQNKNFVRYIKSPSDFH